MRSGTSVVMQKLPRTANAAAYPTISTDGIALLLRYAASRKSNPRFG
jgi:hypothetical protein